MISVIIPVKDRSNERVQRCIDSVKEKVDEVIVVDYGSKVPVKVKHAKTILYSDNEVFNKSHALNIGIKNGNKLNKYIMTMDCDIIVTNQIMDRIIKKVNESGHTKKRLFIINTNVRRIEEKDVGDWKKSEPWLSGSMRMNAYSRANGGIQLFPRDWIFKIHGYDEELILWGGIDNDMYERAYVDGLEINDLNMPMYHQEHPKKELNLENEEEREAATYVRMEKIKYLETKIQKFGVIGKNRWGGKKANQNKFKKMLNDWRQIKIKQEKKNIALIKKITKTLEKKETKKMMEINGVKYHIFTPEQ